MLDCDDKVKLFHEYFLQQFDLVTPMIEINSLKIDLNSMYSDINMKYCFDSSCDENETTFREFIEKATKLENFHDVFSWNPAWTIHVSNYKSLSKSDWNESQRHIIENKQFSLSVNPRGISVIDRVLVLMAKTLDLKKPGISHEYFKIDNMLFDRYELDSGFLQENKISPHCWWPVICVEHENSAKDWLDELNKLAHVRAEIKIVIGYCLAEDRDVAVSGAKNALNKFMEESRIENNDPIYLFLGPRLKDLKSTSNDENKIEEMKIDYKIYKFHNHEFKSI